MIGELNPGLIVILGALLVPLFPGRILRGAYMLLIPVAAFAYLQGLPMGEIGRLSFFDLELVTNRVDPLSNVFATIFLVATLLGLIYALHVDDWLQVTAGLLYAGSAIGAVFAGDFLTLFVFWEITAITSVFLVWASRTDSAMATGLRYLIIQVGSGVILMAGVLIHYHETKSLAFGAMGIDTLAGQLILVSFGIKAAFPLLHNWLEDAYPKATVVGAVFLSAFTTKLAIYALVRAYEGTGLLVPIGLVMTVFPVIYAILENDLRRVLAYALIGQLGLMVVGIGLGGTLAVNGAVAHAVTGILYFALLFMGIGAVLHRTGTAKASELGGLFRSMPWTTAFTLVGAASIAALPLFAGFASKSLVLSGAMKGGAFGVWLILLATSAAAVLHTAAKVPYYAFFNRPQSSKRPDSSKRPTSHPATEAPLNMLIAMGLTAALCIAVAAFPEVLYGALPYEVKYDLYTVEHVATQLQLVAFALLAFALAVRHGLFPRLENSILLDTDWFYRVPGRHLARIANRFRSLTWEWLADAVVKGATKAHDALYRHHGPDGPLGRTWPTGTMAFWTTVTLGAVLVVSYL